MHIRKANKEHDKRHRYGWADELLWQTITIRDVLPDRRPLSFLVWPIQHSSNLHTVSQGTYLNDRVAFEIYFPFHRNSKT